MSTEEYQNIECKPRVTYIPVYHRLWRYPQYVEVTRCVGYDHGYNQGYRCVATKKGKPVTVPTGETVYSHTGCAMKCACLGNGGKCTQAYPGDCYPGTQWDPYSCKCVPERNFSYSRNSKNSTSSDTVSVGVLVGCMIGEFVVVVAVSYFLFHPYSRRRLPEGYNNNTGSAVWCSFINRRLRSMRNVTEVGKKSLLVSDKDDGYGTFERNEQGQHVG